MAIKVHTCSFTWLKVTAIHPCWRVRKALDDQGIEYEVVTGPLARGKRDDVRQLSGQDSYPVIEFEDGTAYRAESKEMEARIRAGELRSAGAGAPGAA